jgi:hypothetical protein
MKVTLTAYIPCVKEVEMTPEEFCRFRSGETWNNFFPEKSVSQDYLLDEEGKVELDDFLYRKNNNRG